MRRIIVFLFPLVCIRYLSFAASNPGKLADEFRVPPASARPWAYWFWVNGNIDRAGLTADLEAMQRVGLGGAILFNAAQDLPQGAVRFGSAEWRDLFKHTVAEARRLGLEINMHNAPGWSGSGGPWITPELGMQMLVCSKTNLMGPAHFHELLPPVRETNGWSLDV